jgi:flavin reductase (DIM6/NTAB) family NADH-FMN oxidoreductase RutF
VTGLSPVRAELVDAPYVGEFPMILECKLIHHFEIGLHTQFIGEILDVRVDEDVLDSESKIIIESIRPFIYAPYVQQYLKIGEGIGKAFEVGKKFAQP